MRSEAEPTPHERTNDSLLACRRSRAAEQALWEGVSEKSKGSFNGVAT